MLLKVNTLGRRILVLLLCYGAIVGIQFLVLVSIKFLLYPIVYKALVHNTILLGFLFFCVNALFFILNHLFSETIIALTMLTMLVKMGSTLAIIYPLIESNVLYNEAIVIFVVVLYFIHLILEFFLRKKILTIT